MKFSKILNISIQVSIIFNLAGQKTVEHSNKVLDIERVIAIDTKSGMKIYWLDSELYEMAKGYNLQDSLFENPTTIKSGYTLLKCYPKLEVEKYYSQKVISDNRRREWKLIENETEEFNKKSIFVKSTKDYIELLNKYPRYKNELLKIYSKTPGYENFIDKLLSGEVRIIILPEKVSSKKGQVGITNKKYIGEDDKLLPIK
jgi:hypothetical protein